MHLELLKPLVVVMIICLLLMLLSYYIVCAVSDKNTRGDGSLNPDGAADVAFILGLNIFLVVPGLFVSAGMTIMLTIHWISAILF